MKKIKKKLLKKLKNLPVNGCITGSIMLDYFDGQDIDLFLYDEYSFYYMVNYFESHKRFQIADPAEKFKLAGFKEKLDFYKWGVITLKFLYNNSVDVNIIMKKNCKNSFSVLETFDMDMIAKAYDIRTSKYLDLTGDSHKTKIANINSWNPAYSKDRGLWELSRILRQLERPFKYFLRGWNVDNVIKYYIKLLDEVINTKNFFKSESFEEILKEKRKISIQLKEICLDFLEYHKIDHDDLETIKGLYKKL